MWRIWLTLAGTFALASAVHAQTYAEKVAAIPAPSTESDWQHKCAALRQEVSRQRTAGAYAGGQLQGLMGIAAQGAVGSNIAALESRVSDFHCATGYVDPSSAKPRSNIDSCIEACKANTSRTPDQCFDACNH